MNKDHYLTAIITLLKEEGLGLSMEAIASKTGISRKTLYNRFSSKDQMIDDCLEHINRQFRESLSCMDDRSLPASTGFHLGVNTLRQYFKDMSHTFMRDLMEYYPQKASLDHSAGSSYFEEKIAGNIKTGQARGEYRLDIDPALFAKYIAFSIFAFFKKEVMQGNICSADHYFEQVINFNINALLIK